MECRKTETWTEHLQRGGLCFSSSTFYDQRAIEDQRTMIQTYISQDLARRPVGVARPSGTPAASLDSDVQEIALALAEARRMSLRSRGAVSRDPAPSTTPEWVSRKEKDNTHQSQAELYISMLRDAVVAIEHNHRKTGFSKSQWKILHDIRTLLATYRSNIRAGIKDPLKEASLSVAAHSAEVYEHAVAPMSGALREREREAVQIDFTWRARVLRKDARHILPYGELPTPPLLSKRGRKSLLQLSQEIRDWVSTHLSRRHGGRLDPTILAKDLSEALVSGEITDEGLPDSVTASTVRRWLKNIGFQRKMVSKGMYHDGHERADVVEYRNGVYLPQMEILELRMAIWDQLPSGDRFRKDPILREGEREIIPIFHDETALHAQEMPRFVWVYESEQVLRQKSDGKLFMISDFIMEEGEGRLILPEHLRIGDKDNWDARRRIEPGKNG
jgi:hypothetical protein